MRAIRTKLLIVALSLGLATPAFAASTVNPNIPAQNSALNSAPLRGNFGATANDINNILTMFPGSSFPNSPSVGQFSLKTNVTPNLIYQWTGSAWVQTGTFDIGNGQITPYFGNSLLAWQQLMTGGGGLGTSGQCVTSRGASLVPTMQSCVAAASLIATEPLLWNSGTLTLSFDYAHSGLFTAVQGVSLNAGSLPATLTGTVFRAAQADGVITRVELDSFGTSSPGVLSVVYGRGTGAAPTAVQSGDEIGSFNSWGYTGAGTLSGTAVAAFRTYAAENFSSGHQGSKGCISTTPIASTTLTNGLCQLTGVTIGSPSGGDEGAGSLNAGAVYVNGVAVLVNGGALGTPSSGVATNLTGTAAALTAGTVTTNANLTGPITSSGNATAIASQTGTGTKFVVDTGPTIASLTVTTAFTATSLVTNADLANAGAYTFKGNVTSGSAAPTDFTVASLTNKASPVGADEIMLADSAAGGATKYATLTQALGAVTSGVSALNSLTGGLTLVNGNGIAAIVAASTTITITADIASSAQFLSATANKVLDGAGVWSAATTVTTNCGCTSNTASPVISVASPGVVTWTAHGLLLNTPVVFSGAGLPTGIAAGTVYYVSAPATNSFNVAAAPDGTAINTTGTSTGSQTVTSHILIDLTAGLNFKVTFVSGSPAVFGAPIHATKGNQTGVIDALQPASGSAVAPSFDSGWSFSGGTAPTFTATVNKRDWFAYRQRSTANISTQTDVPGLNVNFSP